MANDRVNRKDEGAESARRGRLRLVESASERGRGYRCLILTSFFSKAKKRE